tara:strand:+ start:126 stop:554 length:429 start_codon:yes stop_codon:yes gene_type:complete
MKNTDDVLDEVLGVLDPVEKELGLNKINIPVPVISRPSKEKEDVDADYEYQRENFYNLIEKGQDAIQGILNVAKESDHPRGYEVAGNLIKQVAEVTEKLGDLQEKMKKLKEVPNSAPKNVTNALFVGSTAELQKMLKGKGNV